MTGSGTPDAATAQTFLFVPGDRPERFDKAVDSSADVVILDLEDAVSAARKSLAREAVGEWLRRGNRAVVRVNSIGTTWHDADVEAIRGVPGLSGVLLPMAEDPASIAAMAARLQAPLLALIETARGLLRAPEIAACPPVVRLALGTVDLAADLETDDQAVFDMARTWLVVASRAAGLEGPVDTVTTDLSDPSAASRDAHSAVQRGMRGKLCIHPAQVEPVRAAFRPSPAAVSWARGVLQAGGDGGVGVYQGSMIDEPVLVRARRILSRAGSTGT